jgi:KaiC/GvpD/RAD55 family RecA-like ATPase
VRLLFRLVHDYYERYPTAKSVSSEELKAFYDFQYPSAQEKDFHISLINEAFSLDVRPELAQDMLEHMVERHFASGLVSKLLPVVEGSKYGVVPELYTDVEEYHSLMANPPVKEGILTPNTMSVAELIAEELAEEGLDWHIPALTNTIGKVRRKTLGLIYAFVDSGKTSFALSAASAFAKQLSTTEECIVYAGNEEGASRVNFRFTQALLNITKTQFKADPVQTERERQEKGWSRVRIFDSVSRVSHVRKLLEEYRPLIMFIDQATKVDAETQDKEVTAIRKLFNQYRELAKMYDCAIIGVTQGVGDAENKKWLKLSDIYGSRVAIQGELDYAIGIGRIVDDPAKEHTRFINVPKNKLHDGEGAKIITTFIKDRCLWRPVEFKK